MKQTPGGNSNPYGLSYSIQKSKSPAAGKMQAMQAMQRPTAVTGKQSPEKTVCGETEKHS